MARWDRAIAALPFRQGRVLDLGCSVGYATAQLRRKGYQAVGVDNSPWCIAWAKRLSTAGEYALCSAEELPLPDASFDGILCLDVLEHVTDETAVMREMRRLLKPGGTLVISVPHQGLLWWFDSLNVYAHLVRLTHHGLFPEEIEQTGIHRHYSLDQLSTLLGSAFRVQRVSRTGLGFAEWVNLPLLVLCRYILGWEWTYQILRVLFWLVYLLEELVPVSLGQLSWHLMVVAMKEDGCNLPGSPVKITQPTRQGWEGWSLPWKDEPGSPAALSDGRVGSSRSCVSVGPSTPIPDPGPLPGGKAGEKYG